MWCALFVALIYVLFSVMFCLLFFASRACGFAEMTSGLIAYWATQVMYALVSRIE